MAQVDQQITAFSEDLLSRFLSSKDPQSFGKNDHAEVELTLGLSLNGRFGTEPRAKNDNDSHCLERSSSISDSFTSTEQSLGRSWSLPAETEEEWQRRKEILSLRRLKAKRKRWEKQRNTSSSSIKNNDNDNNINRCRVSRLVVESGPKDVVLPGPHGSDTAQAEGGGDLEKEMPCVWTTGVGPNGKRVEGFLCRYSRSEAVRIVCVCHGSFWSPAEFVKHGGGGDRELAHPLKHIVVTPASSSSSSS